MPRQEVIHLGEEAFQNAVKAITDDINIWNNTIARRRVKIARLGEHFEGESPETTSNRQAIELNIAEMEASRASLSEFHRNILNWRNESMRILGHVLYAPPISVCDKTFTEDWALVELDREKFNWNTFQGNVIYLGSERAVYKIMEKMYAHPESQATFKNPFDGLMQLRGFVKYDELFRPTMLDSKGERCLIVVKNGGATGVTTGRATGILSFTRVYKDYAIQSTSREIAIYDYTNKDGGFCAPGDSGAVVGDAQNRIVGMITGGTGLKDSTDVSYVTPYYFLMDRVKVFPNAHLYPIQNLA